MAHGEVILSARLAYHVILDTFATTTAPLQHQLMVPWEFHVLWDTTVLLGPPRALRVLQDHTGTLLEPALRTNVRLVKKVPTIHRWHKCDAILVDRVHQQSKELLRANVKGQIVDSRSPQVHAFVKP